MGPADLARGVAAADADGAGLHVVAGAHHDPRADGPAVRHRPLRRGRGRHLVQLDLQPVAERTVAPRDALAPVAEQRYVGPAVDDEHVRHAVHVEVVHHGAAPARRPRQARPLAHLDEAPVGAAQQHVVGVEGGEVAHRLHVALGDDEVEAGVVVHVRELRVPAGGRSDVAARIGAVRRQPERARAVLVDGSVLVQALRREGLHLGVAHGGERVFGTPVIVEIGLGDAHAPDGEAPPAVAGAQLAGGAAGRQLPHLLVAAAVVLPVVGDPKRGLARAVPVREQDGQRAEAGLQLARVGIVRPAV